MNDKHQVVEAIDAEMARLSHAREILLYRGAESPNLVPQADPHVVPAKLTRPYKKRAAKKMSTSARKKISEAMKERWRKSNVVSPKKAGKKAAKRVAKKDGVVKS